MCCPRRRGRGAAFRVLAGELVEVAGEPAEVIARIATIEVAKGSGMVCGLPDGQVAGPA